MQYVDHNKNIIRINNISYSFDKQQVLRDISFNVHQGDYLGIIGPNGGGKTTLVKIILGLLKPSVGTVEMFGEDIGKYKNWQKIGYIPQKAVNFEVNFPATVREVVSMGLFAKKGLLRFLDSDDQKKVTKVLKLVEMEEFDKRLIGDLSGGEQQRVFIAKALVTEPSLLILDEPTAGIDIKAQEKFYTLLKDLNKKLHITLIMISHEIDVIAHEATEFACINETLFYHGPPKEFFKEDFLSKLYGKGVRFLLHSH